MERNILAEIKALFEEDSGRTITDKGAAFIHGMFVMLSKEDQAWVQARTPEDLGNICIGETRYGPNEEILWVVDGDWTALPTKVEEFLNNTSGIVEGLADNADGYVE